MIQDNWFLLPLWLQILCLGFASVWVIQLTLMLTIRIRPLWRIRKERLHKVPMVDELPPVSIVVYAHNQAEDLQRNLPLLLGCNYPDFEVIVVDDGSTDETEDVLTRMDQISVHFFHTTIAERIQTVSRRKLAMLLGVKAAHNEIVLMTQAQCAPATTDWLTSIGRLFAPSVDAVVGPVVYESRTGFMNRFYQWDFFERLLTMYSLTSAVKTYGGWSYNMAFRKSVFFEEKNRAIQSHLGIHPGEDDLFLNAITKKKNIALACNSDAMVINQQTPIDYNWKRERLNRAFTHRRYFFLPRLFKLLEVCCRYLAFLSGVTVIGATAWCQSWWMMGIAIFLFLTLVVGRWMIPYYFAKKFGVHRYKVSPLVYALWTPLVDLWFAVRVLFKSGQFYVGRID